MSKRDEVLRAHSKQMRGNPTPAEARLWYHLRAKRLNGVKFVRQSVRRPFIADFIARSHKFVIEIDGDTHGTTQQRDTRRTAQLNALGYRVLRFTNGDVMTNEPAVLEAILAALGTAPLPDPLPASGEREIGAP